MRCVGGYRVFCETRGHANPGCPWEEEGKIYSREFVVTAEDEADAIAQVRQMTDIGPYRGENFKAVALCPVCHGDRRLYCDDIQSFFERLKALHREDWVAAMRQREAEAIPCPECQN
jgi:hypothetical protein